MDIIKYLKLLASWWIPIALFIAGIIVLMVYIDNKEPFTVGVENEELMEIMKNAANKEIKSDRHLLQ